MDDTGAAALAGEGQRVGWGAVDEDRGGGGTAQVCVTADYERLLMEFEDKVSQLNSEAGASVGGVGGGVGGLRDSFAPAPAHKDVRAEFQRRLEACFEEVENDHDLSRLLSENDFSHLDPISVAQVYMSSPVFMCGNVEIRVCCACVELPSACMRVL